MCYLLLFLSQVWVGQAGFAEVQRLKSSLVEYALFPGLLARDSSFVLSIFFDTARRLQKVSIQR